MKRRLHSLHCFLASHSVHVARRTKVGEIRTTNLRHCVSKRPRVSGGSQSCFRFEPDSGTRQNLVRIASRPPRRRMAEHREESRNTLPFKLAIIVAASLIAGVIAELFLGKIGLKGYGWLIALVVAMGLSEPLLDARNRIKAWKKGAEVEESTEKFLRKLPADFVVMHDLAIPGSKANIDHLVVGPTGVFVVDSKNYRGKITENKAGELWSGKYPMARAIETVNWEATKVAQALGGIGAEAILCVHGAELPRRNIAKNGVRLAGPRGTLRILQEGPAMLGAAEIQRLSSLANEMGRR